MHATFAAESGLSGNLRQQCDRLAKILPTQPRFFFIASLLLWKPGGAGDERLMMLRMAESGRPYSSKRHTHRKRMLRYGLSSSTRGVWLGYQHACRAVCVCVAGRQTAGAEGGVYQTSGAIIMTRSWTTIKLLQVSTSWPAAQLCVCVCVCVCVREHLDGRSFIWQHPICSTVSFSILLYHPFISLTVHKSFIQHLKLLEVQNLGCIFTAGSLYAWFELSHWLMECVNFGLGNLFF